MVHPSTTHANEVHAFDAPETTRLGRMAASIAAPHPGESGFLVLDRGRDALSWRLALADAAEKSIDAMYFLWKNDAVGKILIQRLLAAADRGVRVRVLIDDSMTEADPRYLALFGAHPNVHVRLYKPFGLKRKSLVRWVDYVADMKVTNRRMHNKLYLVDAAVEIVGGRNIANEYFEFPGPFVFRSRDLLALGPVVGTSGGAFDAYWNSDWAVPIEDVVAHVPDAAQAAAYAADLDAFAADPSNFPRGFLDRQRQIDADMAALEESLLWGRGKLLIDEVPDRNGKPQPRDAYDRTGVSIGHAAEKATSEALIQSAYLILEEGGAEVIKSLIGRGVTVKLATNSMAANNHLPAFVSYRKQRARMLAAGAEVYEYRPDAASERAQFTAEELAEHKTKFGLHAKTMVFDRKVVFVGSFNLDPRSVDLNTEMGLLVESEALGEAVARSIENDIAAGNSWRVILDKDGKPAWVTVEDGVVTEEYHTEPMTTAARRAEADALALVPDDKEM